MEFPAIPLGPDAAPRREFVARGVRRQGLAMLFAGGALLVAVLVTIPGDKAVPWLALGVLGLVTLIGAYRAARPARIRVSDGTISLTNPVSLHTPAPNLLGVAADGGGIWAWFGSLNAIEPKEAREQLAAHLVQGLPAVRCPGFTVAQADELRQLFGLVPPSPDEPAGRVESFYRTLQERTPTAIVTPILVGLNVAVFFLMILAGTNPVLPTTQRLIDWGANYGPRTLTGEWWRLLTCMFLHIGVIHLLCNMWALVSIGAFLERLVGRTGLLVLYLTTGLLGSAASLLHSPTVVSAGASGAIFGLFGGMVGYFLARRHGIPPEILSQFRRSGVVFVIANVWLGLSVPGIDLAAHVGGAVAGLVLGLVLGRPTASSKVQVWPTAVLGILAVGIAVAGLALRPLPAEADLAIALDEFAGEEDRLLSQYNAAIDRLKQGQLTESAMTDLIERDILPAWRKAAARLARVPEPDNPRQRQLLANILTYARTRQEGFELYVQGFRQHDPSLIKRAQERMKEADRLSAKIVPGP